MSEDTTIPTPSKTLPLPPPINTICINSREQMASALSNLSLSTPSGNLISSIPKPASLSFTSFKAKVSRVAGRGMIVRPVKSSPTPPGISEKVQESIEKAQETCEGDAQAGECAAAWDEVEELSAAASHARDKARDSDPLEAYCKDNPETAECRTYDD